jgi:hypothetical protein
LRHRCNEHLHDTWKIVDVNALERVGADEFFDTIPEDALDRWTLIKDLAIRSENRDDIEDVLVDEPRLTLASPQRNLCALPLFVLAHEFCVLTLELDSALVYACFERLLDLGELPARAAIVLADASDDDRGGRRNHDRSDSADAEIDAIERREKKKVDRDETKRDRYERRARAATPRDDTDGEIEKLIRCSLEERPRRLLHDECAGNGSHGNCISRDIRARTGH